jgi:hypothetical protein
LQGEQNWKVVIGAHESSLRQNGRHQTKLLDNDGFTGACFPHLTESMMTAFKLDEVKRRI